MTTDVIERLPIGDDDERVTGWLVWSAVGGQLHGLTGVGWPPLVPATGHAAQVYAGVQAISSLGNALTWLHSYGAFERAGVLVLGQVIVWRGPHVERFRRGTFGYPLSFEAVVRGRDGGFVLDERHGMLGTLRGAYGVGKRSAVPIAHGNLSEAVPVAGGAVLKP